MCCYNYLRFLKLYVYEIVLQKLKQQGYSIDIKLEDEVEKSVNECFKFEREPKELVEEVYRAILNKLQRKK